MKCQYYREIARRANPNLFDNWANTSLHLLLVMSSILEAFKLLVIQPNLNVGLTLSPPLIVIYVQSKLALSDYFNPEGPIFFFFFDIFKTIVQIKRSSSIQKLAPIFVNGLSVSLSLTFVTTSVTRLGDLLHFGQLFKAFGIN